MATVTRKTKETDIEVTLELAGVGAAKVETTNPFLSHLLETMARYSGFDITVRAKGDLDHHLVEDVAIVLGQTFKAAFALRPCTRIASHIVPMDDALMLVAVDLVDRPYYEGELPIPLWEHFLRSFAMEARINLHVVTLRGRDAHHCTEAAVKALATALRLALAPRASELSTKGIPITSMTEPEEVDVAGAAHLTAAQLAGASTEVRSRVRKRELPEVKAARARDREIHGDT